MVTGALTGCATRRVDELNKRLNNYWEGVRWRSPGAVSMLVTAEQRQQFLDRLARRLDRTRVVDFSIVNVAFDDDKRSAKATIAYSYYLLKTNDLKAAQEHQEWIYNKNDGWLMKKSTVIDVPASHADD
jgi:hypothetical protein